MRCNDFMQQHYKAFRSLVERTLRIGDLFGKHRAALIVQLVHDCGR